jgi:PncC family amidohydrolase
MAFKVVFLQTFPSPVQLDCLLELFNSLGWNIGAIEISFQSLKLLPTFVGNTVVISPEIESPQIDPGEGFLKILLPVNCDGWKDVEKLLRGKSYLYRTYRENFEKPPVRGFKLLETEAERIYILDEPAELDGLFYTQPLEVEIGNLMTQKGLTLATAESCTGGMVASTLVNVPGSSSYFKGSVVAYSNEVKESLLGVSSETLKAFGAVSAQTAREMAQGVRELLKTDIALSTTGIAGPGGGTDKKPVGLTYFAIATPDTVKVFKNIFPFGRNQNRRAATYFVLFELYKLLKGIKNPA